MKKIHAWILLVVTVVSCGIAAFPVATASAAFDKDRLIDDPVFNDENALSASAIDAFLNGFPNSCISPNSGFEAKIPTGYSPSGGFTYGNFGSAGQVIAAAAQAYDLNPKVIIVTLEKEQSLVSGRNSTTYCYGTEHKYTAAVGYGCPDSGSSYNWSGVSLYRRNGVERTTTGTTCVNAAAKAGFTQQIIRAAWLFKFTQQRSLGNIGWAIIEGNWNNSDDLESCYSGPVTQGWRQVCPSGPTTYYDGVQTIDGESVQAKSGATIALYRYTPHFHGNENFVTIWTNWFGSPYTVYESLIKPRWMRIKADTQKYNIATDEPTDDHLTAGQQIFFPQKISLYGKVFLRSQYDTNNGNSTGILLSDVEEIPWTTFASPRWMRSNQPTFQKVDPLNGDRIDTPIVPGQNLWIASQIVVNGKTYVRTQHDTDNGLSKSIPLTWLSDITDETVIEPRRMLTTKQTGFVNDPVGSQTPSTDNSLAPNTEFYFSRRINVNNKWYVADTADATGKRFVPLDDLREISFGALANQRYMRTTTTITKKNPASGQTIDPSNTTPSGTDIFVVDYVNVNSTLYYRSLYDHTHGYYSAILGSQLIEIPYEPAAAPRYMRATRNIWKVDPRTGKQIGEPMIAKGQQVLIASKITVNGVLYVRTQLDTNANVSKGLLLSDLQEL